MRIGMFFASVALNVLVIAVAVLLYFFGDKLLSRIFMETMHARWVSQFEVLPVNSGDIVFLP